jgi:hypothetical protein
MDKKMNASRRVRDVRNDGGYAYYQACMRYHTSSGDSPITAQATREGVLECLLARHGSQEQFRKMRCSDGGRLTHRLILQRARK